MQLVKQRVACHSFVYEIHVLSNNHDTNFDKYPAARIDAYAGWINRQRLGRVSATGLNRSTTKQSEGQRKGGAGGIENRQKICWQNIAVWYDVIIRTGNCGKSGTRRYFQLDTFHRGFTILFAGHLTAAFYFVGQDPVIAPLYVWSAVFMQWMIIVC